MLDITKWFKVVSDFDFDHSLEYWLQLHLFLVLSGQKISSGQTQLGLIVSKTCPSPRGKSLIIFSSVLIKSTTGAKLTIYVNPKMFTILKQQIWFTWRHLPKLICLFLMAKKSKIDKNSIILLYTWKFSLICMAVCNYWNEGFRESSN